MPSTVNEPGREQATPEALSQSRGTELLPRDGPSAVESMVNSNKNRRIFENIPVAISAPEIYATSASAGQNIHVNDG